MEFLARDRKFHGKVQFPVFERLGEDCRHWKCARPIDRCDVGTGCNEDDRYEKILGYRCARLHAVDIAAEEDI